MASVLSEIFCESQESEVSDRYQIFQTYFRDAENLQEKIVSVNKISHPVYANGWRLLTKWEVELVLVK